MRRITIIVAHRNDLVNKSIPTSRVKLRDLKIPANKIVKADVILFRDSEKSGYLRILRSRNGDLAKLLGLL